jgi:hypothetical protein
MRTAEEILADTFLNYAFTSFEREALIKKLIEARKEAIEECAKVATTRTNDESTSIIVDKQSILDLINELK